MNTSLLDRPTTQPPLATGGDGTLPPKLPPTAFGADQPPEHESFPPNQQALKIETHLRFHDITSHLGDVAAKSRHITTP